MPKVTEVKFEKWKSSDRQREIHFFVNGTDLYVFGYNPNVIKTRAVKKFLTEQGFKISGLRVRNKDASTINSGSPVKRKVVKAYKSLSDDKNARHSEANESKREYIVLGKTYYSNDKKP